MILFYDARERIKLCLYLCFESLDKCGMALISYVFYIKMFLFSK